MRIQLLAALLLSGALLFSCAACGSAAANSSPTPSASASIAPSAPIIGETVAIVLSDSGITVDGASAATDSTAAVYIANDIIYYHDGTDESYGEGAESDMHSAEEAAAHTVVHITQPGVYRLSGSLSQGQIFVDLGEDAAEDPDAVVTLILDDASVTCTVAPALLFYSVYECGSTETATATVDTSAAGANVILAAGSENHFTGASVAKIYKEGTEKKLHKYDGAFYSKMSMNLFGDSGDDSGVLNVTASNEGLDAELHLTINGGTINITADNDGINTNEDGFSVTTINGGIITIDAGLGIEGDGIDSNGYLVINGGTVYAMANETSADGGLDADSPIFLNGGTVSSFGNRNESADTTSAQPYMELSFASALPAGSVLSVRDESGTELWAATIKKLCQTVTLSCAALRLDTTYAVYVNDIQQSYTGHSFGMMGGGGTGGQRPDMPTDGTRPSFPTDGTRPSFPADGTPPSFPADGTQPGGASDQQRGQRPNGAGGGEWSQAGEPSTEFTLTANTHSFSGITDASA